MGAQPTSTPCVVAFRTSGGKSPLFLIHGVDGTMRPFQHLAGHLDADQPLYGVLAQGLLGEKSAFLHVEDLAAYYLRAIDSLGLAKPYHFLGYSFGALLAYEMARLLSARGESTGMVGMLDNLRMGERLAPEENEGSQAVRASRREQTYKRFRRLASGGGINYVRRGLIARTYRTIYTLLDAQGRTVTPFLQRTWDLNLYAGAKYRPASYPGRVTLYQASVPREDIPTNTDLWMRMCGQGAEVVWIPGNHEDIVQEPNVQALAKAVTEYLANIFRPAYRLIGRC